MSVEDFTGWGTGAGGGQRGVWEPRWRGVRVGSDRGFAFEKLALGTGPSESARPDAQMPGAPGERSHAQPV